MTAFLSMILRNRPLAIAKPMGIESASSSVTASMLPSDSASSAAPSATDSSGCTPLRGGLPKCRAISCWTSGMRDWPPTRMISSMLDLEMPSSASTRSQRSKVRSTRSRVSVLSCSRDSGMRRSSGFPLRSSMYGSSMTTLGMSVRSIFAASAAFLIRCIAMGLWLRSTRVCCWKVSST